ncbi:receptor-like protein 12 [Solanum tuberosum]|uniref:receptor-like protein 12 n=1 Tax=Solanum tuberosum TaxID=4113 RepID=UPI00073A351C|nr:PREDICTED: receptor-like protein 12 [Solanum tuberosum]
MGRLFFFHSLVCFLLVISESISSSSVMMHHVCSPTEAFALLHFKQSFRISDQPSCWVETHLQYESYDIPKTKSWNESRDCCSWDGVTCDMLTSHVIGLDLSCSLLNGAVHPNSSLFQLHHLRTLNLAYNDFNSSSIPHNIGRLMNLRHLNLSHSFFEGEIPTEISYLSNLVSLDLYCDYCGLQLDERTFETMLQNFTNLERAFSFCQNWKCSI